LRLFFATFAVNSSFFGSFMPVLQPGLLFLKY